MLKNELEVKGFSAVSEEEMMNVDGGSIWEVIHVIMEYITKLPSIYN